MKSCMAISVLGYRKKFHLLTSYNMELHCTLLHFPKILKKLKNLPPSGVRVMSWSRNWPNCITMWVNSFLPGFEPLSPGVACIAFDTSRGLTFTWAMDVSFTQLRSEQVEAQNSCPEKYPHLAWQVQVSCLGLAFQVPRNQARPIASSQWQLLPNSGSSSCCTCRRFFELCRIFRSQSSHPCTLHLRLLLTERERYHIKNNSSISEMRIF